jgi:RND family efflux transporter MFP subunit
MTDMMPPRHSLIAAVGAVIVGLVLPACADRTKATPADEGAPVSVTVATLSIADLASTFEAGGVVQAQTTATITARILAPVREIRVAPGSRVRAGQVLVVLDGSDLAARARGAHAGALAADQGASAAASEQHATDAALTLARATYKRISGLHAKRSATAQELDDATGALWAAEARAAGAAARARGALSGVDGARAASEAAATTAAFAVITAPFDGVVTEKMVEPGNMASPGTPLLRLEDTRRFRLDVRVDESRIADISERAVVPITLDSGSGGAPTTVSGTVTEIGRAVDADARAFLVKIALPDATGLRSGTFGRAHFAAKTRRALAVPVGALVQRGQMTSVFVVENGVARLRLVNVRGTEVLAGLAAGDVVIVGAPPTVSDGSRVTVASLGGRQ